jgi:hypothetical protein
MLIRRLSSLTNPFEAGLFEQLLRMGQKIAEMNIGSILNNLKAFIMKDLTSVLGLNIKLEIQGLKFYFFSNIFQILSTRFISKEDFLVRQ